VLSVIDNGIGIAEKDLKKIFERYFQSERRPSNKYSGLGMGLVLVQEIVRLHGGSVIAASPGEGEGSTFTVTLPLEEEHGSKPNRTLMEEHDKRKILVIDDNRDAADALVKLLNAVGYEATAAYSGTEGTAQFTSMHPSHVIVDLSMPGMDGYDVAKYLRSSNGKEPLRLIALSGYGMEEDKKRAENAGFDCHLTKPVGLYELQNVLEAGSQ
jgi:CheY-like chemotaxis protein